MTALYEEGETIMIKVKINDQELNWDGDPDLPLLWFIRDEVGLTGTKFGCGQALCGSCTVIVDKQAVRACITSVSDVRGREVTTIEGLHPTGDHRCKRPGGSSTCRNAAFARPVRSCRQRRC
ncbi:aerobic-type carbon monoxide dehydrogenase small subunit (CoxS/CutS family) [Bradyrhizobium elkanii]